MVWIRRASSSILCPYEYVLAQSSRLVGYQSAGLRLNEVQFVDLLARTLRVRWQRIFNNLTDFWI